MSRFAAPDKFPLLLAAVLSSNWRNLPLHESLREWGTTARADGARPVWYFAPLDLQERRAANFAGLEKARPGVGAGIDHRAPIATVDGASSVTVDGMAD